MQGRPSAAGPSNISSEYHPSLPPSIPLSSINTLIPRLTTTINDIDHLRNLIGAGYADGTLPSWDTLLQRYSLLLGRINALTNYISPAPNTQTQTASSSGSSSKPSIQARSHAQSQHLSEYLIHPLNPLPTSAPTNQDAALSPFAQETFLQAINTQLIPTSSAPEGTRSTSTSQSEKASGETHTHTHTIEQLKRLDEGELEGIQRRLKIRLNREGNKIHSIKREIERQKDEIDWTMRIGEDEEEEEEDDEEAEGDNQHVEARDSKERKAVAVAEDDEDDDDDLFGGDGDEEEEGEGQDEPMIIDVDAEQEPRQSASKDLKQPDTSEASKSKKDEKKAEWKLEDYIGFMDNGKLPISPSTG
ncbi:uncharacterized protein I303_107858 [Kwoniella dejecticola CBS 10117]|uniref:Uncharacterized protein n=1 Tax=Kwoniella dejecticola CBS 10117 TaxID=1296121 RepID=A0A1A5ZVW9_9TREE|nr:uncharacterized protein I303_07862 [Kwoniella dejecticola CBS 10117]OBR81949.1 hypothetical protein I303_07862 [Kwoniella dejecticola CBS 10117]